MMIVGIGIDIVSNERIKKIYEKFGEKFLRKVFTDNEIKYCFTFSDPIPHLAGRFAVKEAVIKALDKPKGIKLKSIEVVNTQQGMPEVLLADRKDKKFLVTLSHEKTHTVALAIVLNN